MKNLLSTKRSMLVGAVAAILALASCSTSPEEGEAAIEQLAEKEQKLADLKDEVKKMEQEVEKQRSQIPPAASRKTDPAPPPQPKRVSITLPEGTPVVVRTTTEISTKVAATGDPFEASLEEPLMAGNTLVAPKGSRVTGFVAHSDKGGRIKGRAALELRLQTILAEDGQSVDVNTDTIGMTAKKATKKDALKVGIGAGIGAAIGAIAGGGKGAAIGAGAGAGAGTGAVLLTRGNAAVLPAESVLGFTLGAPATIQRQR